MEKFAGYVSTSPFAAYALLAYQTAYLNAHYPALSWRVLRHMDPTTSVTLIRNAPIWADCAVARCPTPRATSSPPAERSIRLAGACRVGQEGRALDRGAHHARRLLGN